MSRYIEGSTTINVKRNLLNNNIQRPAITLCNNNRFVQREVARLSPGYVRDKRQWNPDLMTEGLPVMEFFHAVKYTLDDHVASWSIAYPPPYGLNNSMWDEVWMQQYGACQTLVTDGPMEQLNPNFPTITLTLTENFNHTCPHHVCFNYPHHMGWTLIIHPPTETPFQLSSTIDSQCAEECLADMMVKKWGDGACQLLWMSPQPDLPLCTTLHQIMTLSTDYYFSILHAPASVNRRRLEGCRCLADCVLKRYSMEMLDRLPAIPSTPGIIKAQVNIYLNKERNIQEKKWSYPAEALLADLGGYLGFTIGASCLTLYHILESALIALVTRLVQAVRRCTRPG
ncbi:hypothetical protein Pmani_019195 [Petrolisthes manimaculis]|uniref:Uncharacterized protein n=1 Tax=Petrolisthes manimaculis TaxID=1843537 RepID=A0AAE1PJD9_9EUCA|nr:hypothetical protein Pmani_019195 [Petrolisthes manimaculis]